MTFIHLELAEEGIRDENTVYVFRNKTEGLYVGYDGYDTDFYKGTSAFIREQELTNEYNKKLYAVTHATIIDMLTKKKEYDKLWGRLGGFDNLEIVKLNVVADGTVYDPIELLNLVMNEEQEIDYEQFTFQFNND